MNEQDIKKVIDYLKNRKDNNLWASNIYDALEKVKGDIGKETAIIGKAVNPGIVRKIIKGELK